VSPRPRGKTAAKLSLAFVPSPAEYVTSVVVDGEAVLHDAETGSLHRLNRTATVTWQCLDGDGSVREIAADIAETFALDRTQTEEQLLDVIRRLGAQGLLAGVRREGGPPPATVAVEAEADPAFLPEPPNP